VVAIGGAPPELGAIARDPRIATRASLQVVTDAPPGAPNDAILLVRADRVFHRDVPKLVAQGYRGTAGAHVVKIAGDSYDAVYATDRQAARRLIRRAHEAGGIADELGTLATTSEVIAVPPPYRGFTVAAADPAGVRRAERRLVGSLRKAADGIAAKAINRSLSLPITRLLCRTQVHPNHITIVALLCALAGGVVIGRGGYAAGIAGMLLVELGSILDGIDGELAQLRFQFSRTGQWLDTVVDDVANVAYTAGVIASLHAAGVGWAVPVGVAALVAFAITQGTQYALIKFVYRSGDLAAIPWAFQSAEFLGQRPSGARAWIAATAPKLLKRDFVVTLFLAFAVAGRLDLILLGFSGGAFVFLGVFIVQLARNHRSLRPPTIESPPVTRPVAITGGVRRLRVALVSTYPPAECGIANYTRELVSALGRRASEVEVTVLAERHARGEDAPGVLRTWHRREDWVRQISEAVASVRPDVVHVQHEEAILGQDRRIVTLLDTVRRRGISSAITLHTVYDGFRGRSFHPRLAEVCDRLIVHQGKGMASVLAAQGIRATQIAVIAHGTPALELPERAAARALLGLPMDVPIALFFGFIHRRKRVHVAAAAFEAVADRLGGARLVIAGRMRQSSVIDPFYARYLQRVLRPGIEAGRIIYRPGFVAAEHKAAYYAAADLVVLPHDQPYGSASGVLHEAIAARRAFVCTRGKKFAEAVEAFADEIPEAFPAPGDGRAWQRGFEHMLQSARPRTRLAALLGDLAERTSWGASADRHASLYRGLADDFRGVPNPPEISHS
jgi:glycosyltransferase involved in cell wall biosynthesis/phosphatidylglycerophosphate synthase